MVKINSLNPEDIIARLEAENERLLEALQYVERCIKLGDAINPDIISGALRKPE